MNKISNSYVGSKNLQSDIEQWYVVYTKSRQEKKVEKTLIDMGYEAYCPTILQERQWSDRKKKVQMPLFSCYCFVRIKPSKQREILFIPGIVRYIYWQGKPAYAQDKEIAEIKKWLNDFERDTFSVQVISEQDRVKIKSGIFIEQEGILLEKSGNQMVLLLYNIGIKIITNLKNTLIEVVNS